MKNKKLLLSLLLVACCSSMGCGSSSSDHNGTNSGINDSRLIKDLTDSDLKNICKRASDLFQSGINQESLCEFLSVSLASGLSDGTPEELAAQCKSEVTSCLTDTQTDPSDVSECTLTTSDTAGCTRTAEELDACLLASSDALSQAISSASCDNIKQSDSALFSDLESPSVSECNEIQRDCPNLFHD